jgi:hypothetical protein
MWRILPGLVGQTGVTDLRQSPQGTPLLFPRRHPQLSVISQGRPVIILRLVKNSLARYWVCSARCIEPQEQEENKFTARVEELVEVEEIALTESNHANV